MHKDIRIKHNEKFKKTTEIQILESIGMNPQFAAISCVTLASYISS